MKKKYRQLSQEQRYQIDVLLKAGKNKSDPGIHPLENEEEYNPKHQWQGVKRKREVVLPAQ